MAYRREKSKTDRAKGPHLVEISSGGCAVRLPLAADQHRQGGQTAPL